MPFKELRNYMQLLAFVIKHTPLLYLLRKSPRILWPNFRQVLELSVEVLFSFSEQHASKNKASHSVLALSVVRLC